MPMTLLQTSPPRIIHFLLKVFFLPSMWWGCTKAWLVVCHLQFLQLSQLSRQQDYQLDERTEDKDVRASANGKGNKIDRKEHTFLMLSKCLKFVWFLSIKDNGLSNLLPSRYQIQILWEVIMESVINKKGFFLLFKILIAKRWSLWRSEANIPQNVDWNIYTDF